jgi:hypothetical protein
LVEYRPGGSAHPALPEELGVECSSASRRKGTLTVGGLAGKRRRPLDAELASRPGLIRLAFSRERCTDRPCGPLRGRGLRCMGETHDPTAIGPFGSVFIASGAMAVVLLRGHDAGADTVIATEEIGHAGPMLIRLETPTKPDSGSGSGLRRILALSGDDCSGRGRSRRVGGAPIDRPASKRGLESPGLGLDIHHKLPMPSWVRPGAGWGLMRATLVSGIILQRRASVASWALMAPSVVLLAGSTNHRCGARHCAVPSGLDAFMVASYKAARRLHPVLIPNGVPHSTFEPK